MLNGVQLDDTSLFDEYLLINLINQSKRLKLCSIYRSPRSTSDNDKHLVNLINSICNKYSGDIFFISDFNFLKISLNNCTPKEENATKNESDLFFKCVDNNFFTS